MLCAGEPRGTRLVPVPVRAVLAGQLALPGLLLPWLHVRVLLRPQPHRLQSLLGSRFPLASSFCVKDLKELGLIGEKLLMPQTVNSNDLGLGKEGWAPWGLEFLS